MVRTLSKRSTLETRFVLLVTKTPHPTMLISNALSMSGLARQASRV